MNGPVLIFIAAFLWSTDALFRQPLTKHLDSTTIVLLEHLFGLGILIPLAARKVAELKLLNVRDWAALAVIGVGGSALATLLFTSAFQYVGPSVAILLQKVQPLVVILLAIIFLRERPRPRFWLWAVVALGAAYVVSFPDLSVSWSLYDRGTRGILYALGAAVLWGISTVLGRSVVTKVSSQTMSALRFLIAAVTMVTIMTVQGTLAYAASIDLSSFFRLIAIVFVTGAVPILIYYKGLRTTRASVSTVIELVFPLSAVILNWTFLGDTLRWQQIVAGVLLVYAIIRVQRAMPAAPEAQVAFSPAIAKDSGA